MIIYLLRHGTTSWNAMYKIQGASDIPLDHVGESIARATGEALFHAGIRFQSVFSSPLSRAYKTAELVSPGSVIYTDPRLTELSFGDFEGRSVPDMTGDPGCAFRFFKSDPFRYNEEILALGRQYPERHYESLSDLLRRTESFVSEIMNPLALSEPANTHVLISGHGALNKALMMAFKKNKDLHSFWGKGLQKNCGVNRIVSDRDPAGNICYHADEYSQIFYDPKELGTVGNLL